LERRTIEDKLRAVDWTKLQPRAVWAKGSTKVDGTGQRRPMAAAGREADKEQREYCIRGSRRGRSSGSSTLPTTCRWSLPPSTTALLRTELVREIPEAVKPRRIAIDGAASPQKIEQKIAAW